MLERRTGFRRFRAEMKSIVFVFLLAGGCGVAVGLTREYIFNTTYLTWEDAQSYCREHYKDLATITTVQENKQLVQSAFSYYGSWIGLNKTSGAWTWSDGDQASFRNWYYYNYFASWEYCTAISPYYQNYWLSDDCTQWRTFYCYRFLILVQEKKTWEEAQQYCRTHYTGLASVTSKSSLTQLTLETAETQTESVWTGLRFVNGIWLWVNGEQLASLVSMPSCPASAYRCGALDTTTNTFKNHNCNDMLNFVCYWT